MYEQNVYFKEFVLEVVCLILYYKSKNAKLEEKNTPLKTVYHRQYSNIAFKFMEIRKINIKHNILFCPSDLFKTINMCGQIFFNVYNNTI